MQVFDGRLHGPVSTRGRAGAGAESGGQGWPVNVHSSLPAMTALSFVSSVKKLPRYFLADGAVTSRSRSREIESVTDGSFHAMAIERGCVVSQTFSVVLVVPLAARFRFNVVLLMYPPGAGPPSPTMRPVTAPVYD